jgi:hypothetical protein
MMAEPKSIYDYPADIQKTAEELFAPYSYLADGPCEEDVAKLILAERKRCAAISSQFTMKPDTSIYPGVPFAQMNETAKMAAHTTAQQIAAEIMGEDEDE